MKRLLLTFVVGCLLGPIRADVWNAPEALSIEPQALVELLPIAADALQLYVCATERERLHVEELKRRGIAEVPPQFASRYVVNTAGLGELLFDTEGELVIDRRFVKDDEMETIRAVEAWIAKWFPSKITPQKKNEGLPNVTRSVPVFCGFESPRYQAYDQLIIDLTTEFNANKMAACGGTVAQARHIADLTPAIVKAHMIEETGGNDPRSLAAWAADPLQVNVPGDWGAEKELVGLTKPEKRNEGTVTNNVRAAIAYLSRKGFSSAARPAAERPKGFFDGWLDALRRYNGRRDRTQTNRYYSDEYADKIIRRAANPKRFEPIEIRVRKGKDNGRDA